jgi:PAS domain S-box-containing protein
MLAKPLEEALSRAGDGVAAIDPQGKIILWNRAAEQVFGYTARETTGRACCDFFVGYDDRGNRVCYAGCHVMALVKLGDAVQSFDMRTRTKAGRPIWINVSTLAVPVSSGAPALTVHLIRDVTASKELLTLVGGRLPAPTTGDGIVDMLTRRELEILRLISDGTRTKAAAARLRVSPATVRNHVQNLLGKLGVHSRLEAVARAHRTGLL